MTFSEKIRKTNNKIGQNKAQYDLDRQTAKTSVLSLENVNKYKFRTGEDGLTEKDYYKKLLQPKYLNIHHYVVS